MDVDRLSIFVDWSLLILIESDRFFSTIEIIDLLRPGQHQQKKPTEGTMDWSKKTHSWIYTINT